MDGFSPEKLLGEIFWNDEPLSAATNQCQNTFPATSYANQAAFIRYRDLPRTDQRSLESMSKRMIGFLRKSWPAAAGRNKDERERCFRHMMSERMRRQRQKHSCFSLHSILPHGTKTDNNSVIQKAAKEIHRLQACREELRRENSVLESNQQSVWRSSSSKLHYLRVPYSTSGIDSMVETLKRLKGDGMNTRSIKSSFSQGQEELFAVLEIESNSDCRW